jgi:membrane associated rhomboid family serine protease
VTTAFAYRPWEAPDLFPLKPAAGEFGYLRGKTPVPCTLPELQERVRRVWGPLPLIWTPESPRVVPSVEAFCLYQVARERVLAKMLWSAIRWMILGLILGAVVVIGARMDGIPFAQVRNLVEMLVIFMGAVPAWQRIRNYRVLKTFTERDMLGYGRMSRYQAWLRTKPRVTTWLVGACILIVAVCQIRIGWDNSIELAALIKPLQQGQWWRLLTCALMHGGWLHLAVNFSALLILGRWMEAHTRSSYLPLVFVVSALVGSFAFLKFGKGAGATVGASGGLMGMIGFLGVMGYRRRAFLPNGFFQMMLINVILVGCMGMVAPDVIDNAAHFGGLAAGVVIGLFVFTQSPIRLRGPAATAAGSAAMVLIVAVCAQAVSVLWRPILPQPVLTSAGIYDMTDYFTALYGKEVAKDFQIESAFSDATHGVKVDTIKGVFAQSGTYLFKFDEFDEQARIYQTRWIRARVGPDYPAAKIVIDPKDSAWVQYRQGTIQTQPGQRALVRWIDYEPNTGGGGWNLAGIQYVPASVLTQ